MPKIAVMICGCSGIAVARRMALQMHPMDVIVPAMEFEIRRAPEALTCDPYVFKEIQGKKTGHDNFKPPEFHYGSNRIKKRGWGK